MDDPLVLIVEDDVDTSTIFASALRGAGLECEIIRTGDEALTRLAETAPALVILDLQLPGVSGEEILRQIRVDARLAETRVIVATALPNRAKDLEEKADLVLLKPVGYGQLRALVERMGIA
jgi:DNA-binding response OmpR family regulator